MTKDVFVFTETDSNTGKLFYTFPTPQGLTRGEYEYYITSAGGTFVLDAKDPRQSTIDGVKITVYDCGVAQVGKISRSDTTYTQIKTYEQYQS